MDKGLLANAIRVDGPTLRSRQQKRSSPEIRPVKRLFTPAIKRHLKSWLVRRRENPYPNREEKIALAAETGLTYIQICNWFANWRRKLKNSGKNVDDYTWSTLIKGYNDQALGNVEHLSISSDDSIWEETEMDRTNRVTETKPTYPVDHCYSFSVWETSSRSPTDNKTGNQSLDKTAKTDCFPQCFQISSTTDFLTDPKPRHKIKRKTNFRKNSLPPSDEPLKRGDSKKRFRDKNSNYKRMMNKFGDGCDTDAPDPEDFRMNLILSKWRKSAALFRSTTKTCPASESLRKKMKKFKRKFENFHGREELDAAEALTFLARASKNK